MLNRYSYKGLSLDIIDSELFFVGKLGLGKVSMRGMNIVYLSNGVFIASKQCYKLFLGLIKQMWYNLGFGCYVELSFVGLGYRFFYIDEYLYLKLGYSHYIKFKIPGYVHLVGFKNRLIIFGVDICSLHKFVYLLRKFRMPDVYKGKGILIRDEVISLKVGKKR